LIFINNRLKNVLDRLSEYCFTLKTKKCAFAMNSVVFLGYLVSEHTISPAPALLSAINRLSIPKNLTDVRALVGLMSYTRKCIKDFSINIEPIIRLTKKNIPFVWSIEQNNAFEKMKNIYKNTPFLCYFNPELETQLSSDASLIGLGAALSQKHDDNWLPVGTLAVY